MPDVSLNGIEFTIRGSSDAASDSIRQLQKQLDQLTASLSKASNVGRLSSSLKQVGNVAKTASKGTSQFLSSIVRIAKYRLIRSALKAMASAFQEGLKNAYEFSKGIGGELAASLDTIATKSLTMKNQMGAAFGGLITALTPVLVQVISIVNAIAAAITRLIAILGGSSTWMKAKDVWTEWGEAAGGAGGAAKEALKYLAPFDELNRLPDANKGGGGGGGSTPNIADMFDIVSVEEGSGLGDALANAFQGIADFFENRDWKDLADKAWEGLKNAFSDTGEATKVIRAISEALGAAIGAAASFIGEFALNLAKDIYASIKAHIVDYNGDGKISAKEFLDAVFFFLLDKSIDFAAWAKANIVDPFMEGFAQAFGFDNADQLEEKVINFGISLRNWFATNVINPVIEDINSFIHGINERFNLNLPTIPLVATVEEITLGSDVHASSSGRFHGGSNGSFSLDIDGEITKGIDKIPAQDKKISTLANMTKRIDNLSAKARILNAVANMKTRIDNLSSNGRTLNTVANMKTRIDNLSAKGRTLNTVANMKARIDNLSSNGRTLNTVANMKTRIDNLSSNGRTLNTVANMNTRINSLSDSQRTFGSWANFNAVEKNLSTTQRTFPSWANFTNREDNLTYYQRSIDARANFTSTTIGYTPSINVNANIVSTSGGGGRALGGIFENGVWHDLPQYAKGGRVHGSVFVAGEAGPEIVGHVGGRTEVLNRSQLAATMYSAVRSAMVGIGFHMAGSPTPNYSMDDGMNEETMYRAFSRALADSDLGGDIELDGDTLYRAMVNRNRANTRLTGVNAMA